MFEFDNSTGEIWIYDVIGSDWFGGVDGPAVHNALKRMDGRDITVRVSSPGGDVWAAVDIHNALERYQGRVTVSIDALAASAASFLILAADEVQAAKNSMLMIHSAMSINAGNAAEHQKAIEMLGKADTIIADTYIGKTGRTREDVLAAMEAETWFTAQEAMDWGLVDSVGDASGVTAHVPDGMFAKTPDCLKIKPQAGTRTEAPYRRIAAAIRARKSAM